MEEMIGKGILRVRESDVVEGDEGACGLGGDGRRAEGLRG